MTPLRSLLVDDSYDEAPRSIDEQSLLKEREERAEHSSAVTRTVIISGAR